MYLCNILMTAISNTIEQLYVNCGDNDEEIYYEIFFQEASTIDIFSNVRRVSKNQIPRSINSQNWSVLK